MADELYDPQKHGVIQGGGELYDPSKHGEIQSGLDWKDVPGEALKNALPSAGNLASSVVQPVIHPIDTAKGLWDLTKGVASKAVTPVIDLIQRQYMDPATLGVEREYQKARASHDEKTLNAVTDFYKNRYGSEEGFKTALARDPVGVLADAASVLSLGGSALKNAPGMAGKAGGALQAAGNAIDPINNAVKAAGAAVSGAEKVATPVWAGLTGASPATMRQAATSGYYGNPAYIESLRGKASLDLPVDLAQQAVGEMARDRSRAYTTGMDGVKQSAKILDQQPVLDALNEAQKKIYYGGLPKNKAAAQALTDIENEVLNRFTAPGTTHMTPEGFDAMKQAVGGIRMEHPQGSPARMVANDVYNSITSEIGRAEPKYAQAMKDYGEASDKINEMRKVFGTTDKATKDRQLRALQSVMRDGVQANYGKRAELGQVLNQYQPDLLPSLAGQTMNSALPRGISRYADAGLLATLALTKPYLLPVAALASPRVAGEVLYAGGRAAAANPVTKRGLVDTLRANNQLTRGLLD